MENIFGKTEFHQPRDGVYREKKLFVGLKENTAKKVSSSQRVHWQPRPQASVLEARYLGFLFPIKPRALTGRASKRLGTRQVHWYSKIQFYDRNEYNAIKLQFALNCLEGSSTELNGDHYPGT